MRATTSALIAGLSIAAALTFSACSDSFYFDGTGSKLGVGDGGDPDGAAGDGSSGSLARCASDPDCRLANLYCDQFSGACVECVRDTNCPATSPRCDGALHRCVNCGVSGDCKATPPETAMCESTTHTCIVTCSENMKDTSCPAATPKCLENQGLCIQCRSNADCVGNGTKLECDPLTGRCTECDRDDECPGHKPRCDRLHDVCVECTSSGDCPAGKPLCDPSTYTCVTSH